MFRMLGYEATTIGQIAAAAEISESTFFRYFPTKEAVALWDDFDPVLVAIFKAQPADMTPIAALRAAFRAVLGQVPPADMADLRQRVALVTSVPELRAAMLNQLVGAMQMLAEVVAERTGRSADDFGVRTLVGAVVGALMSVTFTAIEDPEADWAALFDKAIAHIEAGLPL